MKNWLAKNKGLTIVVVIAVLVVLVAVVAGPSIFAAVLAAHGL